MLFRRLTASVLVVAALLLSAQHAALSAHILDPLTPPAAASQKTSSSISPEPSLTHQAR